MTETINDFHTQINNVAEKVNTLSTVPEDITDGSDMMQRVEDDEASQMIQVVDDDASDASGMMKMADDDDNSSIGNFENPSETTAVPPSDFRRMKTSAHNSAAMPSLGMA